MKTIAELDHEWRVKVVAEVKGRPVTAETLSIAFDAVADKTNWKNPIDRVVDLDDYTKALVERAVIYFVGSTPTFERLGGTTTGGVGRYRVRADGYYLTIGA